MGGFAVGFSRPLLAGSRGAVSPAQRPAKPPNDAHHYSLRRNAMTEANDVRPRRPYAGKISGARLVVDGRDVGPVTWSDDPPLSPDREPTEPEAEAPVEHEGAPPRYRLLAPFWNSHEKRYYPVGAIVEWHDRPNLWMQPVNAAAREKKAGERRNRGGSYSLAHAKRERGEV